MIDCKYSKMCLINTEIITTYNHFIKDKLVISMVIFEIFLIFFLFY